MTYAADTEDEWKTGGRLMRKQEKAKRIMTPHGRECRPRHSAPSVVAS